MTQVSIIRAREIDPETDNDLRMAPQSRNRIVLHVSLGFIATMLTLMTLGSLA